MRKLFFRKLKVSVHPLSLNENLIWMERVESYFVSDTTNFELHISQTADLGELMYVHWMQAISAAIAFSVPHSVHFIFARFEWLQILQIHGWGNWVCDDDKDNWMIILAELLKNFAFQ
jgi:hypothetical protein